MQATYACLKMVDSPNPDINQFTSWRRTSYKLQVKFKPRNKQKKLKQTCAARGNGMDPLCKNFFTNHSRLSHQTIFDPKPQIKIDQNRISFSKDSQI